MPEPVNLIVSQQPVPRMSVGPTKAISPHLAVVYATAAGEVECFDGSPLRPSQQVFSKFRARYEVDMRDHTRQARLASNPMVALDKVHEFEVTVTFSFRVNGWEGAKQWVRGGLPDALPVVHGYINWLFHGAGQGHPIENSPELQKELNALCADPVELAQGLVVHSCKVSVRPDAKSRLYLEQLLDADKDNNLLIARHAPAVTGARNDIALETLRQSAAIAAAQRQADAVAHVQTDAEGLIRYYLATHPEDGGGAFQMLAQLESARAASAELAAERWHGLFGTMVQKGLIESGDVNGLRHQVLGQLQGGGAGGGGTGYAPAPVQAAPWDAPLTPGAGPYPAVAPAQAPAPSPTPGHAPAAANPAAAAPAPAGPGGLYEPTVVMPVQNPAPPSAVTGTALIYLVLDESVDPGALDELNRGLSALHDALSADPAASAALRVCVLGMAADTAVRLQLSTVTPGTRTPILTRRAGLSYEQAFRTLRVLLPQDVALVKQHHPAVLRPMVFLISGGLPDEGAGWREAHRELTDRSTHPTAPQIVACGLGRAEPAAIRRIATQPEFARIAAPHSDASSAAHSCAGFLRESVVGYGQRLAAGSTDFTLVGPDGFRPAADAL